MIRKTRTLMVLLRDLSDTYAAYDRGKLRRATAEQHAASLLRQIDRLLDDADIRKALLRLSQQAAALGSTLPEGSRDLENFVSAEVMVTEGFGFTRSSLKNLVGEALAKGGRDGSPTDASGQHPADRLKATLQDLHATQMEQLATSKKLGKRKKKAKKTLLRKGLAKVTGGSAVMIADATLLPAAAPASFVAGFLAIAAGADDLAG